MTEVNAQPEEGNEGDRLEPKLQEKYHMLQGGGGGGGGRGRWRVTKRGEKWREKF